jgi:hypothetical protein
VCCWVDREKLSLLLLDREQAHGVAVLAGSLPRAARGPVFSPFARRLLLALAALFVLVEANIAALSISKGPEPIARRVLAARLAPNERIELLRSR